VIGSRYSTDTFRVRDFMAKNRMLFTWVDIDTDPQVDLLLKQFGVTEADTPVVACSHMLLLRNPSNRQLADEIGIRQPLEQTVYDLVVVGGGWRGWLPRSMGPPKGYGRWCWSAQRQEGRPGAACGSRTISAFHRPDWERVADRAILQPTSSVPVCLSPLR